LKKSFQIIAITQENFHKNEVSQICKLLAAGCKTLHVRKPHASTEALRSLLFQIPKPFYKNIVLHSHYELLKEFKLKGAHLPEKTRLSASAINFLHRNKLKIISTSFHSEKEINLNRRKYEYVFLSPIFASISKANYKGNFDLEKLKPLLKKKNNVVALGGINHKNLLSVQQAGFSAAASIGSIWKGNDPAKNYKKLISKIK
jgi:thiamine-phosphate pyrophosphorylase